MLTLVPKKNGPDFRISYNSSDYCQVDGNVDGDYNNGGSITKTMIMKIRLSRKKITVISI
jgi:hypothetical protein